MSTRNAESFTKTEQFIARSAVGGGKSVTSVLSSFAKADTGSVRSKETGMSNILVAECKRLAGRAAVIGNTAFNFDKHGICRIKNFANVSVDFAVLVRQNGVRDITASDPANGAVVAPAEPAAIESAPELSGEAAAAADIAPPGADLSEIAPAPVVVADGEQPVEETPAEKVDESAPKKSGKKR